MSGECNKIYIYTNNQCSQIWTSLIANYFDYKLKTNSPLFDKIICAFKINNKQVELMRTSHDKTYDDFIKCTLLPKTTEICFVDNSNFDKMKQERVYYIKPRSYYHNISIDVIINRFIESIFIETLECFNKLEFKSYLYNQFHFANCMDSSILNDDIKIKKMEMDIHVSQKIMYHLKDFFLLTRRKQMTKKKYNKHSSFFTRRKK
jgi:hypothetical protein